MAKRLKAISVKSSGWAGVGWLGKVDLMVQSPGSAAGLPWPAAVGPRAVLTGARALGSACEGALGRDGSCLRGPRCSVGVAWCHRGVLQSRAAAASPALGPRGWRVPGERGRRRRSRAGGSREPGLRAGAE